MTLGEMSRHFRLCEELRELQELLDGLRARAEPGATNLTGVPHAPGFTDAVGAVAVSTVDVENRIAELTEEIKVERAKVERFIDSLDDARLCTLFRLRFVSCCTWAEVSYHMGRYCTEESVRQRCYRFFRAQRKK